MGEDDARLLSDLRTALSLLRRGSCSRERFCGQTPDLWAFAR